MIKPPRAFRQKKMLIVLRVVEMLTVLRVGELIVLRVGELLRFKVARIYKASYGNEYYYQKQKRTASRDRSSRLVRKMRRIRLLRLLGTLELSGLFNVAALL